MVRILLVQPPHRDTFGYSMPPLGALHLGATARRRGHEPSFLDLALLLRRGDLPNDDGLIAACAQLIVAAQPEVLGFGAMISALPATLHLAAEVRQLAPELPILLGGQGPETVELAVLARHPAIDIVAVGEADETLADVLDQLGEPSARAKLASSASDDGDHGELTDALFAIPGLALRRNGVPELTVLRPVIGQLDSVDFPAFDLAESPAAYATAAGGDEALFPIDLGRGCSYSCSFCTTSVFWGRQVRYLSAERAADAFDLMASLDGLSGGEHPRGCVYVTHDLFTADRRRVLDICAEKQRRDNTLVWECRTRIDLVDEELLTAMVAAGCRRILYGIESVSGAVLKAVDKGGRQASANFDVTEVLRMASRVGMASIVGVMAGIPGEIADDVEANMQLMADAAVIDGCSLSMHWFNVTPGNGQAGAAGSANELSLIPGLHADLVRGYDIPAGRVHGIQAGFIAKDPEIFAGFRIFSPDWATPRQLYLLTRNAHLLLEVLPRSLKACAHARGETLLQTVTELLNAVANGDHCEPAHGEHSQGHSSVGAGNVGVSDVDLGDVGFHRPTTASSAPSADIQTLSLQPLDGPRAAPFLAAERAEHGEPWDELLVLHRGSGVRLASALLNDMAKEAKDQRFATLLAYERALFETAATSLRRFALDPVPLVRAMDSGAWPPSDLGPPIKDPVSNGDRKTFEACLDTDATVSDSPAVLFSRHGDLVRAHALSNFLADAHDLADDSVLLNRWPGASSDDVAAARKLLTGLAERKRSG
ncbi:MAG: radical SAM superfamily enzyme YgiQ (UPF0313 family) [Pseudohongiellaceae bacterium]|jgi:radical SAM superfamily enzyme YgiQ (UPF0313 family)